MPGSWTSDFEEGLLLAATGNLGTQRSLAKMELWTLSEEGEIGPGSPPQKVPKEVWNQLPRHDLPSLLGLPNQDSMGTGKGKSLFLLASFQSS